jgi:hypothetical protein
MKNKKLYFDPPQRPWVGLTDEERDEIALELPMNAVRITEATLTKGVRTHDQHRSNGGWRLRHWKRTTN